MERIDLRPTDEYQGYKLRPGRAFPFGATFVPGGVNFSLFSRHAIACTLVLFDKGAQKPKVEIPFPDAFRIGNVYSMVVFDLDFENIEYGYRMEGPFRPDDGHRFDSSKILLDPYARAIGGRDTWRGDPHWDDIYHHRGRLVLDDFDWEGEHPLEHHPEDLVIYEAHVRSFTAHPSSKVKARGTFAAIRDKIPYLKALGVNCIELMPVYEFDEYENSRAHPQTGEMLLNFWGYSTAAFSPPRPASPRPAGRGCRSTSSRRWSRSCTRTASR